MLTDARLSSDRTKVKGAIAAAAMLIAPSSRWTRGTMREARNSQWCYCMVGALRSAIGLGMYGLPHGLEERTPSWLLYRDCLRVMAEVVPPDLVPAPEGTSVQTVLDFYAIDGLERLLTRFNDMSDHQTVCFTMNKAISLMEGMGRVGLCG